MFDAFQAASLPGKRAWQLTMLYKFCAVSNFKAQHITVVHSLFHFL
jgi:hypothetical protein